jgi:pyruvate/2-oxoglutarate dehydrogenase complex dihydrolipoamide dehydrogenase (E3) component
MSETDRKFAAGVIRLTPDDRHNRDLVSRVHPPDWRNPAPANRYDLVVIGGGTAGLVCAAGAAGLGARVALVERRLLGGDCLNFGCVPSKAVLRAARAWHSATAGASFGAPVARAEGDFATAMARMRALRADIAVHDSAERFRRLGVDVFLGSARFTARDRVSIDRTELVFRRAVIATGGAPSAPSVPGLAAAGYLTHETIFDLVAAPGRLAILGAGPIGCEMAQAFARLGSHVTLLERDGRILPRDDEDAAAVVYGALERDRVRIACGSTVGEVVRSGDATTISFTRDGGRAETSTVDAVLVATGRTPNLAGLDLERAGVASGPDGVRVDARLRTTNRRIFACGDVTGGYLFTHAADAAARIVIRNALFLGRARADRAIIPWCTYTSPELAHVGMNASRAEATDGVDTVTIPFADVDRARLDGDDEGFFRVHVAHRTGRILGATCVGEHAGDIIGQVSLAMTAGISLATVASTVYPYPTHGEVLRKSADSWRRSQLTPTTRRILNAIRYLGSRA